MPKDSTRRYVPNIILTGTPGCGKTTTSELLQRSLNSLLETEESLGNTVPQYDLFNISEYAKTEKLFESFDELRNSHIIDEDALLDNLEPILRRGGNIIDWHCNDIFPERLIDLVVVLRCDNSVLVDRLNKRKYSDFKVNENLDAEIMGVVLQDALDSYVQEIVIELQSNTVEDMEKNCERIVQWTKLWLEQKNKEGVTNEIDEFYEGRDDIDFSNPRGLASASDSEEDSNNDEFDTSGGEDGDE